MLLTAAVHIILDGFQKNILNSRIAVVKAADNVSGLDVATSTELVKKYFENLVF
jgi:hypothetical protein